MQDKMDWMVVWCSKNSFDCMTGGKVIASKGGRITVAILGTFFQEMQCLHT